MTRRMSIATIVTIFAITAVSGCGSDSDKPGDEKANASTSEPTTGSDNLDSSKLGGAETKQVRPSSMPSVDSSSDGAIAIRGQWANKKARWTISFHEDGTFTEDLGEQPDYRTGKYAVEGDVVSMYGLDGTTVKGVIKGEKIVFKRATVVRL